MEEEEKLEELKIQISNFMQSEELPENVMQNITKTYALLEEIATQYNTMKTTIGKYIEGNETDIQLKAKELYEEKMNEELGDLAPVMGEIRREIEENKSKKANYRKHKEYIESSIKDTSRDGEFTQILIENLKDSVKNAKNRIIDIFESQNIGQPRINTFEEAIEKLLNQIGNSQKEEIYTMLKDNSKKQYDYIISKYNEFSEINLFKEALQVPERPEDENNIFSSPDTDTQKRETIDNDDLSLDDIF